MNEIIEKLEVELDKIKKCWLSNDRQGYFIAVDKADKLGKELKQCKTK